MRGAVEPVPLNPQTQISQPGTWPVFEQGVNTASPIVEGEPRGFVA